MNLDNKFSPAQLVRTVVAWFVALTLFFPLGWLILTSFKTELQAIEVPPLFIWTPTLENFTEVQERSMPKILW
jgi:sorbitol/mannitol transport system permease protein